MHPNSKNERSTRKYRIVYLTHGARNVGGGEYALYSLIKNIKRDVFEPVVFYCHENDITRRFREDGIQLVKVPLSDRITSVYRDEIKKNPAALSVYFYHAAAAVFQVQKLLKKYRPDILHPHDNLSKIVGGLAAKISGVKIVTHCHDLLNNHFIERALIYYQMLMMDRIIAVSEGVRKTFSLFGKISARVTTIHNGIDLMHYENKTVSHFKQTLGLGNEVAVIGVIAVFDKCKGHVYLFKALRQLLLEMDKNIVCLVIGDGRERGGLERSVKEEGLERHVRFLGYRNDIVELLSVMDILAIPSLKESFGMVAIEAMAMRVPVVATRVGGLPEIIEDGITGMLVPPANAHALYVALKYLKENPKICKTMGKAAREKVKEKFSINASVKKTEEIYLDVLTADQ